MYTVEVMITDGALGVTLYSAKRRAFDAVLLHLPTVLECSCDQGGYMGNEHDLHTYAVTEEIKKAEDVMQQTTYQLLVDVPTGYMSPKQRREYNKLRQALLQISTKCHFPIYRNLVQREIIFVQEL